MSVETEKWGKKSAIAIDFRLFTKIEQSLFRLTYWNDVIVFRCTALFTVVLAMPGRAGVFTATSTLIHNSHCWVASVTLRIRICLLTVSDAAKPILRFYNSHTTSSFRLYHILTHLIFSYISYMGQRYGLTWPEHWQPRSLSPHSNGGNLSRRQPFLSPPSHLHIPLLTQWLSPAVSHELSMWLPS